jgi:hypothetical protein
MALAMALPAAAQDFQKGLAAHKGGDYATAFKEWQSLAISGDAAAQQNLGLMYANGRGVPQDYAQAVNWFHKAAEWGIARGQFSLGVMYVYGRGVPRDYFLAHMWFSLSAANGYKDGPKVRDLVAKRLTSAQTAQAHKLAREWWAKHGNKCRLC